MRNARGKGDMHDGSAFHRYISATSRACARCIGMRQDSINQEAAVRRVSYGDEVTRMGRRIGRSVAQTEANAWRAMSARCAAGANLAGMFLDAQK
jgi:hypothetical protein